MKCLNCGYEITEGYICPSCGADAYIFHKACRKSIYPAAGLFLFEIDVLMIQCLSASAICPVSDSIKPRRFRAGMLFLSKRRLCSRFAAAPERSKALSVTPENGVVLACGSLYMVGALRSFIKSLSPYDFPSALCAPSKITRGFLPQISILPAQRASASPLRTASSVRESP